MIIDSVACAGSYAVLIMSRLMRVEGCSYRGLLRPLCGSRLSASGRPYAYGTGAFTLPSRGAPGDYRFLKVLT